MIIEFKYDINDVVWFIRNAKVYCGIITACSYFKSTNLGEEYEVKSYDTKSEYGNHERLYEDELFLCVVKSRYNGGFACNGVKRNIMGGTTCNTTHHWMPIPELPKEE